jgi:uncharacterized protein YjbI with pentapeptide repeats
MSEEQKNCQGEQAAPALPPPASVSVSTPPFPVGAHCQAGTLVGEAMAIATGVQSLASSFTTPKTWRHQLGAYFVKGVAVATALIGVLMGIETFFQNQQENARNQADSLFSAARLQLSSGQAAIRANAVRSLPALAQFQNIVQSQPSEYSLGSHLLNRFWRKRTEQPLKLQCWTLFREFAQQPRIQTFTNATETDVDSSALLQEGVSWERRIRSNLSDRDFDTSGSLLFKAKLANAQGIGLDCSAITFGAADLKFANLSSSKFDGSNLDAAVLDGAVFNGASLQSANLAEVKAVKADFSFAKCGKAVFRKATLNGVTFKQTSLESADFTGATLDGASFSQSVLRDTNFARASLRAAVFSQTNVSSASFDEADVDGADFTAAVGISKATLSKARNSDKALLPTEQKNTALNKP